MTTIWMDPVEMRSSGAFIAEQAQRIQETVTGTRTTCSCEVPRSLIGWLDEALLGITEDALRVAVAYLTEVVDLATRANEILADQSLAAAQAGLLPAGTDLTTAILGGTYVGGMVIDGTPSGSPTFGSTTWASAPAYGSGPTWDPVIDMIMRSSGPSIVDVMDRANDGIRTELAPPGIHYENGKPFDDEGDTGSLAAAYEDPDTGELDI